MTLGSALRLWLVGQLFAMALVGILAGLGLWLLGIPSALALGLIAGLLEFVPVVGPIAAAVPAVLLAMLVGWEESLMVAGLYFAIQQVEGYVITPLVQQRAVDLPPALTLFSLIALGTVFGVPGVLLAAPMTVAIYVALKTLYLRLGEVIITPT
jgi:predicted PurR-regulated permease PerM